MMTTGKPLSKEIIQQIRKEILQGKTKYRVAQEMGINESVVRNHTRDLPSLKRGEPYIKGKAVDLLKQLLELVTFILPLRITWLSRDSEKSFR